MDEFEKDRLYKDEPPEEEHGPKIKFHIPDERHERTQKGEDAKSSDHPGTAKLVEVLAGFVNSSLDVSKEMEDIKSSISTEGHAFRGEVIRNASDMSSREKLAAYYQNDDYEMARRRKEAEIGNLVRDNKTRNAVYLVLVLTVAFCAINPNARAFVKTRWHALRKAL